MRVLVVSQYYWPENFRITEVVQALREEGCEVLVLTGQPNYPEGVSFAGYSWWSCATEPHDDVTIFRVPLVPRGRASALRLLANYASFVFSAIVCGSWLLRGRSIDAIFVFAVSPITQAIPAIWLARLKKASVITWVQDLWPESLSAVGFVRNQKILDAVSCLVRWIYRKNDLLLVQSEAFIEPVQAMAGKTPVRYHPNAGDFAFSCATAEEECPLVFEPGFNIVFAGNLGTVQALDTILEAAELLREDREIRLVLVGSGSRGEWLGAEIKRRKLANVVLPGRFALSSMPSIMSSASALLVSLVRSPIMSKTVPSKVQAYLAAGRPIIAALDGEGARVILEAAAGVACPAEDPQALAAAIRSLQTSGPEALERMGANARAYYESNFEPRVLARRLKDFLVSTRKVAS
ncbi:glycosyltransferase family 4 protein [Candidatus Accumulibacter sp. ACC003]|uniref:glycosyltransferase family 4 protein n=1 Tax=Candidatus Accumulibacter sp. ACC003 TaxID=2823334 RepID=UPI0025BB775D|nr:glycosyltransferase family 4 protein [Candidatus Accumulibacter sp. ACC003]